MSKSQMKLGDVPETDDDTPPPDVTPTTYRATLNDPLFYNSKEGHIIETDTTISATALMHALGYMYGPLRKDYVLVGDETTTPSYYRLNRLPFFTSEAKPISVEANERTFRTVSYGTERVITTDDAEVGEILRDKQKPFPRKIDGSNSGWHRMRNYVGLSPGSEFQFTVWTTPDMEFPDELRFRAGIKLTGKLTAEVAERPAETVTLNQYMLENVYGVSDDVITELTQHATSYERGNDRRTSRFIGVDFDWVTDELVPVLLS